MSTYQDTIDYLYSKLPLYSKIGAAAIKKDLHNTLEICHFLGNPQKNYPTIHVAGTNGKGSSSHMLAAVFQAAGYKVGLYTSPHLYDFKERIKVNGQMCTEDFVIEFTENIKPLIEKTVPSFFEITVGMAFDYFAKEACDIAIIETGLGGRLDSTNIITPILSLITNIGLDHTAILGESLEAIAFEKAGIIKPNTPIVISEVLPETKKVFEQKAADNNAPIYFAESLMKFQTYSATNKLGHFEYDTIQLDCDLPGKYQYKNIRGVLVALDILQSKGWQISEETIKKGIANIKPLTDLLGRWECIQEQPKMVLDVAHNVHGMHAVLEQLATLSYTHLHIITGMVKDKDVETVLSLMPRDASFYFTQSHIPRAMPVAEFAEKAKNIGLIGAEYDNVNEAIAAANTNANPNDLILVMGSVFLIAEVNR